ncbi:phage tail protein [Actinoplanes sp. SE50]|uniref:phage tail protein n=1 Tax=unclassified Actinoplanes TaxID=2626549 RepID=UPI00023EC76D|nr:MULTISPECIES: phage tail protein [unclassified Actinoplanes]AEV83108.1 phage tail protein [Actinoplanes sp. SE50/110]ATO81504.1 phage tail protein [Actinoplanes sp. SE50]SLL98911.1 phage tail protein [Actinoplanes sp. SE50/110]
MTWLLAQLPQTMARDPFLAGFVTGCQQVADSVRAQIDDLEHELDVDLASPEMLAYLGSWLAVSLRPATTPAELDDQRRLIRAVGSVIGYRGTCYGLERLLSALTGAHVTIGDPGGVALPGEPDRPGGDVRIEMSGTGRCDVAQVHAAIREELPVGVGYRLVVAGREQ